MSAAATATHAAALVRELNASIQEIRHLWGMEKHVKAVVVEGGIEISYRGRWLLTVNPEHFRTGVELHEHLFHLLRACVNFHLVERAA